MYAKRNIKRKAIPDLWFSFFLAKFSEGRTLNLKEYGKRAFVSKRITTTGKATANYT